MLKTVNSVLIEEFLWAIGNNLYADVIREAYKNGNPLGADNHRRIMQTDPDLRCSWGIPVKE